MTLDIAKEKQRKYREDHKEHLRAYFRQHYLKHKEERLARNKKYYAEHRDQVLEQCKEYRNRNAAKCLERYRRYQKEHPEVWRRNVKKYEEKHPDRVKASKKKYQEAHKVESALRLKERRMRLRKQTIDESQKPLIQKFYATIRARTFVKCYYCGKKISGSEVHVDHVIALSRGGNHAIENLAASCLKCNLSKGAKLPHEWSRHHQMFFTL